MFRWVKELDHLIDNIQSGWIVTKRDIKFSLVVTRAVRAAINARDLKAAGASFPGERMLVKWHGTSFTTFGPAKFRAGDYGIFGGFGLQMTEAWIRSQASCEVVYVGKSSTDIDRFVEAIGAARSIRARAHVLRRYSSQHSHEGEVRVFSSSRIPFDVTDVVRAIVPDRGSKRRLQSLFPSLKISISAPPRPPPPPIPLEDLWARED